MENNKTLVEQSGFLPSTGIRSYDSSVPTQYDEASSLINEAKKQVEKMKIGSYTPSIRAIDPSEDADGDDSDKSGVDTSFDVDTSFSKLNSVVGGAGSKDPQKSKADSYNKLNDMMKSIRDRTRNTYYGKQQSYGDIVSRNQAEENANFGVFGKGTKVNITEAYDFLSNGNAALAKFKSYMPGRDNEDYYGKRQSTWEKARNGVGKLATKTALYGVSGVIGLLPAAYNLIKTGSLSAAFDNDFTRMVNDIDERINHSMAHYYTREERNMGFLESLGTANFLFNDVIGSGVSFTTGAILSAYLTGGLGVSSLGAVGAKIGMRAAGKMIASKVAASAVKSTFGAYRAGAMYGRAIGNMAKVGINTLVGAGWESSVEAQSFMKDSEQKYKEYFKSMYGRNPNQSEMTEFRGSIANTANSIFLANMGIVGLSNYLLLGKYMGLDSNFASKYIPGISKAYDKTGKFVDRYLFGLGVKRSTEESGKLVVTKANLFQKSFGTIWNVSKRPISEGVWEEGMQGVAQRMGEDFIRSRYDKTYLGASASIVDSFAKSVADQFTSREGLKEVGIGALIGGMFGARNGVFGIFERRNRAREIEENVKNFNANNAFTAQSVKDQMRNLTELNAQMNDPNAEMYSKFELSERMGLLDDMAENFRSMVNSLDDSELASEMNTDAESVKRYKEDIINDFDTKLSNYQKASSFAEAVTAETSSDLYRANVANSVFQGLDAEDRAIELAKSIGDYVNDNNLSNKINLFHSLSSKADSVAKRLRAMKIEMDALNEEIERMATSPRRVENGVDTEAERIKEKTIKYEKLNEIYKRLSTELLNYTQEEFYASDPTNSARRLVESETMTVEDILDAYDSVDKLGAYITTDYGKKNPSDKKKADDLKGMVLEYQRAITQYKVIRSFMNSIQDKRFMRHDFGLFSKFMNDMVLSEKESLDSDRFAQAPTGNTKTDIEIDEMLNKGEISSDEAFTMKVFGHLNDVILPQEEQDIVSDEEYEAAMNDEPFSDDAYNRIVNKLFTGNVSLLSPREVEIYGKYKQDFDEVVKSLGDSPVSMIQRTRDALEKVTTSDIKQQNDNVIDSVKSDLDEDAKKDLDENIKKYNELQNKKDNGEDVDESELEEAKNAIQSYGNDGGVDNLIAYVDQNRVIANGKTSDGTLSDFGSKEEHVAYLLNEEDPSSKSSGANVESVQNPEILMARKITSSSGDVTYEVSGLVADKFINRTFTGLMTQTSAEKMDNGKNKYTIYINGETITIMESPIHGRWMIDKASADVINKYTDVSIRDIGTAYTVIGEKSGDSIVPYRTGVGFGVNEGERIDSDTLAETKKGDTVDLEVDMNDSYNQELFKKYEDAVASQNEDAIAEAEKDLKNNLVIKVMRNKKFISVLKADTGGITGITSIRSAAFEKYKRNGRNSSKIELGTKKVAQTLPGRPNLVVDENGNARNFPITEKGAENVVDVGYALNGEVFLKNGSEYSVFPFATFTKKFKGTKVPVVVIKGRNGLNYLYPVSLKSVESSEGQMWINRINEMLDPENADIIDLIQSDIQELNAYLTRLGLDPSEYQVSLLTPIDGLRKAKEAIERESSIPDVYGWVTDQSRGVNDILLNDVEINIDLEGEMFVAPKIRISFGNVSSSNKKKSKSKIEDSVEEEELPFDKNGNPNVIQEGESKTEYESPSEGAEEAKGEETPTPEEVISEQQQQVQAEQTQRQAGEKMEPAQGQQPTKSSGKKRNAKNFKSVVEDIEKHIEENKMPKYANFFDFLARGIASGNIRFFIGKGKNGDIAEVLGLRKDPKTENKAGKISTKDGFTLNALISSLKGEENSVPIEGAEDPAVMGYISSRTDEQIEGEIINFLKFIQYKPSGALNYSLRTNGMPMKGEYATEEEINEMVSKIDALVSSEVQQPSDPKIDEMAKAAKEGGRDGLIDTLKENISDLSEEEADNFVSDVIGHMESTGDNDKIDKIIGGLENGGQNEGGDNIRDEKAGSQKVDGEKQGQPGAAKPAQGNGVLSGPAKGEVKTRDTQKEVTEFSNILKRIIQGVKTGLSASDKKSYADFIRKISSGDNSVSKRMNNLLDNLTSEAKKVYETIDDNKVSVTEDVASSFYKGIQYDPNFKQKIASDLFDMMVNGVDSSIVDSVRNGLMNDLSDVVDMMTEDDASKNVDKIIARLEAISDNFSDIAIKNKFSPFGVEVAKVIDEASNSVTQEKSYRIFEGGQPKKYVTVKGFAYGGESAYTDLGDYATFEQIPYNVLSKNGIKEGLGIGKLREMGYTYVGGSDGSWIEKFDTRTGKIDMYNINTGEAFRAKMKESVKMNSFLRKLNQSGRDIQNLESSKSQEEVVRDQSLVDSSDNKDAKRETNTKC